MKQHITVEQLNELPRRQRASLRWGVFIAAHLCGKEDLDVVRGSTIGAMIEFLGDNWSCSNYYQEGEGQIWCVAKHTDEKEKMGVMNCYDKKELVDALWEAVKEVLDG